MLSAYFLVTNIWSFPFPIIPNPNNPDWFTFSEIPNFVNTYMILFKSLLPVEVLFIFHSPATGHFLWIAQTDPSTPVQYYSSRIFELRTIWHELTSFLLTFFFFLLSSQPDDDLFQRSCVLLLPHPLHSLAVGLVVSTSLCPLPHRVGEVRPHGRSRKSQVWSWV